MSKLTLWPVYLSIWFKIVCDRRRPVGKFFFTLPLFFFKVLIYLDAHCEVAVNWYAPLVAPISKDR